MRHVQKFAAPALLSALALSSACLDATEGSLEEVTQEANNGWNTQYALAEAGWFEQSYDPETDSVSSLMRDIRATYSQKDSVSGDGSLVVISYVCTSVDYLGEYWSYSYHCEGYESFGHPTSGVTWLPGFAGVTISLHTGSPEFESDRFIEDGWASWEDPIGGYSVEYEPFAGGPVNVSIARYGQMELGHIGPIVEKNGPIHQVWNGVWHSGDATATGTIWDLDFATTTDIVTAVVGMGSTALVQPTIGPVERP